MIEFKLDGMKCRESYSRYLPKINYLENDRKLAFILRVKSLIIHFFTEMDQHL